MVSNSRPKACPSEHAGCSGQMSAAISTHMRVGLQSRPNQELFIPLGPGDRAFLNPQHHPAGQSAPPRLNPFTNRLMHGGIADDAFGANRAWPGFELGLYQ